MYIFVLKRNLRDLFFISFNKLFILYALAEKFLKSVEVNQNYPLLLLHLVDKSEINITIRIAGAVAFKNYVKRNWKVVIIYV